jgi:hypothetical protein
VRPVPGGTDVEHATPTYVTSGRIRADDELYRLGAVRQPALLGRATTSAIILAIVAVRADSVVLSCLENPPDLSCCDSLAPVAIISSLFFFRRERGSPDQVLPLVLGSATSRSSHTLPCNHDETNRTLMSTFVRWRWKMPWPSFRILRHCPGPYCFTPSITNCSSRRVQWTTCRRLVLTKASDY